MLANDKRSRVVQPMNTAYNNKSVRCLEPVENDSRNKSAPCTEGKSREDKLSTDKVKVGLKNENYTRQHDTEKRQYSKTSLSDEDKNDPLLSVFNRLKDHYDSLPLKILFETIASRGICPNEDLRLAPVRESLQEIYRGRRITDIVLNFKLFKKITEPVAGLTTKILENKLAIKDLPDWIRCLSLYYDAIKEITGTDFALSLTSVDGQKLRWGNIKKAFPLNELVHVIFYLMATESLGFYKLHETIGMEAKPCSQWAPGNPIIGAGALAVADRLVNSGYSKCDSTERHERVKETISNLAGGVQVTFNSKAFVGSDKKSEYLKAVLSWLAMKKKVQTSCRNVEKVVQFYLESSSLQVDTEALSTVGATLANGGVCATTGRKILCSENAAKALSIMTVSSKIPGVPLVASSSGVVLLIVPSLFSIAIYSDDMSSAGLLISAISQHFALNPYERIFLNMDTTKKKPQKFKHALFKSAKIGDVLTLASLLYSEVTISITDYTSRTILHHAATNGHFPYISFAVNFCPKLVLVKDLMGQTPANTARFFKHNELAEFLENWETVLSPKRSLSCSSNTSPKK